MTHQSPETLRRQAHVPAELAGERVDKVAAQLFSEFSRAELTRWMTEGVLTLDGAAVKPKYKVFGSEELVLQGQRHIREDWQSAEAIALDVLYEDEDIIVVNKPAGLVVHPGAGNASGTLVNGLLHYRSDLNQLPRAGGASTDKETSGIMVVAASPRAYQSLVEPSRLEPCAAGMWRSVKASWCPGKTSINPSVVIPSSGLVKSYGRTANLP